MNDYLMFSLILAVVNTTAFYLLTNRKHKVNKTENMNI